MVKAVVFTDFDGTITLQDSNDTLTDDLGFGKETRLKIFEGVLDGSKSFREGFNQMLTSIHTPLPECMEYLRSRVQIDPSFKDMFDWCQLNNIPMIVVSSGMKPLIKDMLCRELGNEAAESLDIVSNDIKVDSDGSWNIVYRDDTPHGHDKASTIDLYKEQFEADLKNGEDKPIYFYCGDGVSDLSAAKECDLLFAKKGKDLITFCKKQNVPYHEFETFQDILNNVQDVLAEKVTVKELMDN